MEREPSGNRLASDIEDFLGVNLTEQINRLLESGTALDVSTALDKISEMLVEAGVELDEERKQRLREILLNHFR